MKNTHYKLILAFILTGFVASAYGFGVYLFANLAVDMRHDLHFDYKTVGIITGAAQVSFLVFSFATSYLNKYVDGWKISLASTAVTSAALLALSISNSGLFSGCLLILMGGCSASVYVPLAEIVTQTYEQNKRSRILSILSSGTSYGIFINGLFVSLFLTEYGWRKIWLTAGLSSLALCCIGFLFLRQSITVSHTTSEEPTDLPWVSLPILLIWSLALLNGLSLLPFQTYLSPFMREELAFSTASAGAVWSTIGIVGMGSGFLMGWFADKIGTKYAMLCCYILLLCACLGVYFAQSPLFFLIVGALFAFAFYPIFGLIPSHIGQIVPRKKITHAFTIANILIGLGGMCGNFLGGSAKEIFGSFAPVYLTICILFVVQLGIVCILPPTPKHIA